MSSIIYDFKSIASKQPNGRRFGSIDDETPAVVAEEPEQAESIDAGLVRVPGYLKYIKGAWDLVGSNARRSSLHENMYPTDESREAQKTMEMIRVRELFRQRAGGPQFGGVRQRPAGGAQEG